MDVTVLLVVKVNMKYSSQRLTADASCSALRSVAESQSLVAIDIAQQDNALQSISPVRPFRTVHT